MESNVFGLTLVWGIYVPISHRDRHNNFKNGFELTAFINDQLFSELGGRGKAPMFIVRNIIYRQERQVRSSSFLMVPNRPLLSSWYKGCRK